MSAADYQAPWGQHFPDEADCTNCGTRCEVCGDRMCATYGPEPIATCPVHPTCKHCDLPPSCKECQRAYREAIEGSDW